jgi:hypothetical protein
MKESEMFRALLLLLPLCWGCERDNPAYCDDFAPCPQGMVCQVPAHLCSPAQDDLPAPAPMGPPAPAPDLATPAGPAPDLRTGTGPVSDLRTGCAMDSDCGDKGRCAGGMCYIKCNNDNNCKHEPAGTLCVPGPPLDHCGCTSDAYCMVAGTHCDTTNKICR